MQASYDVAGRVLGGIFGGMAKAVEKVFDFLADMIAPAPPPTKDQAERMERVAEEQQTQAVAEREAAEKEARLQELLEQIKRDDAQARYSRYTGAGGSTGATPSKSAIAAAGANESVEPREAGTPGAARSSVPPGALVALRDSIEGQMQAVDLTLPEDEYNATLAVFYDPISKVEHQIGEAVPTSIAGAVALFRFLLDWQEE